MSCLSPFYVDNPLFPYKSRERQVPAPCGKCPPCMQRKSDSWIIRLLNQDKASENALFITLTYDTQHVPLTKKGFMTLDFKHLQNFWKRVRNYYVYEAINPETGRTKKYYDKVPKIKYYACGEYGKDRMRPHYHAIVFNASKESIDSAWKFGIVDFGTVTGDSVAYTTKYLHKGKVIPVHKNDDRVPEAARMSKQLGANYLTPEVINYHRQDYSNTFIVQNGYKKAMPRYYREKIWSKEERENQSVIMQGKVIEKEQKKLQAFKTRTGSIENYSRSEHERKKASIENFKKRANENRNKI